MKSSKTNTYLISLFSILSLIFLLASCGKKEVKPVSEDSKIAQEAFRLAEVVKDAYIRNDRSTIERNSAKDGYKDIIEVRKNFDSAELAFTPRWVEIDGTTVHLRVAWNGTWIVKGQRTEDRGLAVFIMEGNPLKLVKVLRENPFKQPE
jgi:hypothetical protein